MFRGTGRLAMAPFSFSFSNGVVSGPNFSFDIKGPLGGASPASKAFFCSNPGMLIDYVYNAWNDQFNPECKIEGGGWNSGCLQIKGTPNLLSAAGMAIQGQIADWGKSYLGSDCTPQDHTANPPPVYTPPPSSGGGGGTPITPGGPPIDQSTASPDFFGGIGSIGILAAIAVVGLLLLKR